MSRLRKTWVAARFVAAVSVLAHFGCPPIRAQSDDLDVLNSQVIELYQGGKYVEAIPLAEHYAEQTQVRHGTGPKYALALNNLAQLLQATNRLAEAEPLMRRALASDENSLGPDDPNISIDLNNLAVLLQAMNRVAEAEPLMRRALAIDEVSFGPDHRTLAFRLRSLALLLQTTNRRGEAELLMRRALKIDERNSGLDHPDVAADLNSLALSLQASGRLAEAETLFRRTLLINEKNFGPDHPEVATSLNNLAQLLVDADRVIEAEPFFHRALAIDEKTLGLDHPNVARDLNNLAQLLKETDRLSEAEPLMRRALEINEKSLGPNDPKVAKSLNNLALLLQTSGRLGEAESLVRRALSIDEKSLGPEHPDLATDLNSLATMLQATNQHAEAGAVMRPEVAEATNKLVELLRGPRLREAELLYRRAIQIDEKSFGPDHPTVAIILNNLASLLQADSRFAEAEQDYRRALEIDEKSLGPDHRNVAIRLNNLGLLYGEIGDWQSALAFFRRASEIIIGHSATLKENYTELVKATLADNRFAFRHHVLVLHRADVVDFEAREESFQIAQWALQTDAGEALGQMAARFAVNHGDLSNLIREQQDLLRDRKAADTDLLSAIGAADSRAIHGRREALAVIETKLNAITEKLRSEFSEYAALASPRPLTISGVQALLKQDEVLIQFLDVPSISRLPEEAFAWVLTKKDARWSKLSMPPSAIAERVMALRCGLDRTSWLDASQWPESNEREKQRKMIQQVRLGRCHDSLAGREAAGVFPPFDLSAAHELYATLLAPFVDLIERKRLIIVPSGALTSLPFGVLVTEEPTAAFPKDNAGYRDVAWLALDNAITVLPSVASLSGLRRTAKTSTADQPFIGFGNPLLQGRSDEPEAKERAELSRQWQHCSDIQGRHQTIAETDQRHPGVAAYDSFFRGPYANVIAIRAQPPLPETAEELCTVARALGVEENNLDRVVYLGERATETAVENANEQRGLERYRVLQFATHGVLAGQWRGLAEPGLILTPPKEITALAKDDGYLSASEISDLKLNADWVVLSACNTAAGQAGNVEALSGLARAFFYAGARALLVSHWAVKTSAAVKLTTEAFAALQAEPSMGRAEAMRRSINTLMQNSAFPDSAHPSIWAPFVLVGEGTQL